MDWLRERTHMRRAHMCVGITAKMANSDCMQLHVEARVASHFWRER